MVKHNNEILLVPKDGLLEDRIFKVGSAMRGYEVARPFIRLRDSLGMMGYELRTIDRSKNPENALAVVFFETPRKRDRYYRFCVRNSMQDKMYIYAGEPQATYPLNYTISKHKDFKGILTFDTDLVDNKKYFRVDYTIPIEYGDKIVSPKKPFRKKRLLCSISSNKFSSYAHELYSERINAVRFMEKYHIKDFDLYGTGWDKPVVHYKWASAVKLNGAIWTFWPDSVKIRSFPSYKGTVRNKAETLPKYKFIIAYENCIMPGYISEKILEAMLYGCVPVYLGDPDVEKRIPRNCFIDKREYPTYESLYGYMSEINREDHEKYLGNIEKFLNSKKVYPFTIDAFIESFKRMLDI